MADAESIPEQWLLLDPEKYADLQVGVQFAEIDGRLEVVGIEVWTVTPPPQRLNQQPMRKPGRPLRAQDLRLPFDRFVTYARATNAAVSAMQLMFHEIAEQTPGGGHGFPERTVRRLRKSIAATPSPTGGRPPTYSAEHWMEVASVYQAAWSNGDRRPTAAVQRHFGTTKAVAAKWVARCRDLGLLPRTERGRARGNLGNRKGKQR
jgi:transposase